MMENENKITYRKLIAWQKADELAFQVYQVTKNFPSEEKFGLVSQMRRAALSVAANIAEGYTKNSKKDKIHFYNIAFGTLTEIEYYLDFSLRLNYFPQKRYVELTQLRAEVGRLLNGLTQGTRDKWQGVWKTLIVLFLVPCSLFLVPIATAQAANLYFSPQSGSYTVGSTLTLNIYVSSVDQTMNAASGVISFPIDKLEVISLSKTGSIFSFWVQEPSFSNSAGTINFEGIVLNPGFTGTSGKLLAVNFRVKTAGVAALNFFSGSVLANDGKGTNILTDLGSAVFTLNTAVTRPQAPEVTTPSIIANTPLAPRISSPTHPDPNKWYSNSNPKFVWEVSSDITAVKLLYDKYPNSQPTVVYTSPIAEKELENIKDGIYYFHAQFKNSQGWGAVSHFKVQIDTQPPEPFAIKFLDGKETDNPRPAVLFNTTDSLSGIDYYKVKVGEDDFFSISPEIIEKNPYILPLQTAGKRIILVQAFDKAGNYTTASEEFIIKPINLPTITDYPHELNEGEQLIIKGLTYSKATVRIYLQSGDNGKINHQETQSDAQGRFSLVWEKKLKSGIYKFWAEVTDERGAKSNPTDKFVFSVRQEGFKRISSLLVSYLILAIALVVIIVSILFFGWYLWYRFGRFRRKLRKEIGEAEQTLHKAFDFLKEEIRAQIKAIEKARTKRQLTEEEEKLINRLKKDLDAVEKLIKKEIEDIRKEVE